MLTSACPLKAVGSNSVRTVHHALGMAHNVSVDTVLSQKNRSD
jgi:hypothetical protein